MTKLKKKFITLLLAITIVILPIFGHLKPAHAQTCEEEKVKCEEAHKESKAELSTCKARCEQDNNNNDGEISIADLLRVIPGFNKLNNPTRLLLVTATTLAAAYFITYIPAPNE